MNYFRFSGKIKGDVKFSCGRVVPFASLVIRNDDVPEHPCNISFIAFGSTAEELKECCDGDVISVQGSIGRSKNGNNWQTSLIIDSILSLERPDPK